MNHGSLFSGIGGFDLAAEWMGWNNVFHCEWNKFGQRVLKYYWPEAISYENIITTDFTIHRGSIDILTGGFPCQPYSTAGKRKGKEDDRHLWPEMLRAIREIQPSWVVGENVSGLINWSGGLVFEEVQSDLEAEGYEVQPYVLPSCAVDAPHRRDRVWFIAYSPGKRQQERQQNPGQQDAKEIISRMEFQSKRFMCDEYATKPCKYGFDTCSFIGRAEMCNICDDGDNYEPDEDADWTPSDTDCAGWAEECKPATQSNQKKQQYCQKYFGSSSGSWKDFPTQSPVCSRDDGLSIELDGITFSKWRNESIKAYGNAIVPQVVYQIFKAISNIK